MRTKKTILRRMTAAGLMLASALLLIIAGCRGNLGRTQTKANENSTWYKDTAALEALYQKATLPTIPTKSGLKWAIPTWCLLPR